MPYSGTASPGGERWGVVLLAHGSRQGSDTPAGLCEAVSQLQDRLGVGRARVVLACLEFIPPTLSRAVHGMVAEGFRRVVVAPYLLGQGKHPTLELRSELEKLRLEFPGLELRCADGLGTDLRLADLVADRVREISLPREEPPAGVLLVKAGTPSRYDDCTWLEEMGRLVAMRLRPQYAVAVAQSHHGPPTMEAAAARLVNQGVSTITCVPYLFFNGKILRSNIIPQVQRLQSEHPAVLFSTARPLGNDARILEVVWERVQQALGQMALPVSAGVES